MKQKVEPLPVLSDLDLVAAFMQFYDAFNDGQPNSNYCCFSIKRFE